MVSENDNDEQKNTGRSQSSPLNVEQIKKQIVEGMKEGLKKEMGYKGAFKNIAKSKPVEDLKEEILKKAEEKENEKDNDSMAVEEHKSKESLREGLRADQVRIEDGSARQLEVARYKREAEEETKEEIDKRLKEMGVSKTKRKITSKAMGKATSEMAFRIAQKMAEEAKKGGINAIVIIIVTLAMATWIDVIDILMEVGLAVAIASLLGAIPGAIVGFLIWLSNFFLSLTIVLFWTTVLGGGHKKWFWKRLLRLTLLIVLVEAVPIVDLLPWTIFAVCWNWYDFEKDKRKAGKDLKDFQVEFQGTNKINKKYANYI